MALYSDSQHAALPPATVNSGLVELFPVSPAHFANGDPRACRRTGTNPLSNKAASRERTGSRSRPKQPHRSRRGGVDFVSIMLALLLVFTLFLLSV